TPCSRSHRRMGPCVVWLLFHKTSCTRRPFSLFVRKALAALRSAWSASTTKNSACWPLAVCTTTHGAILFTTFTVLPPTRWLIAREEPIAPNAATPAATRRSEQKTDRNRDDVNLLFRFVAIESPRCFDLVSC